MYIILPYHLFFYHLQKIKKKSRLGISTPNRHLFLLLFIFTFNLRSIQEHYQQCSILKNLDLSNMLPASNANLYKFAYFAGGTVLIPPTNACWGRFPKPLRSPPVVTAARSANAGFYIGTKRKSCVNGFPIHTAFLLPVYLAEVNFQNVSLSSSAKLSKVSF